ncbi:hypothetical protein ABZ208_11145 [Streptomyces sp. NPDC006208]|uniref:hypothetical protein n=1 Tax=Streptomyces sp. NPDC006208 TaxID=3156734 RepID=UPI0033BEBB3E
MTNDERMPVEGPDAPAPEPAAPDVPAAPAATPARPARRALRAVLPGVLVLAALGGSVAYAKHTVDTADTTAPTEAWDNGGDRLADDPAKDADRGRADTPLSRLLAPVDTGSRLGPDIESYGNDTELSGKQAAAMLKATGKGLSGAQRREFEKAVEKVGLQGFAMRSYSAGYDDSSVVETYVGRMKSGKAVRSWYANQTDLYEALGVFRKGPRVKGHKNATCFVAPKPTKLGENGEREKSRLGRAFCVAYDGDVFVHVAAYGTRSAGEAAAWSMQEQLDHMASPGEYV